MAQKLTLTLEDEQYQLLVAAHARLLGWLTEPEEQCSLEEVAALILGEQLRENAERRAQREAVTL
jgi:hypothetical protein